jgi:hypothetical protein
MAMHAAGYDQLSRVRYDFSAQNQKWLFCADMPLIVTGCRSSDLADGQLQCKKQGGCFTSFRKRLQGIALYKLRIVQPTSQLAL